VVQRQQLVLEQQEARLAVVEEADSVQQREQQSKEPLVQTVKS
jgi:hypothetical protein